MVTAMTSPLLINQLANVRIRMRVILKIGRALIMMSHSL